MRTNDILKEIERLPIHKRIYLIERTLNLIRNQEYKTQMEKAADELNNEYRNNKELTIFTNLDYEDFYESR